MDKVRSLNEELYGLGLTKETPGGEARLKGMLALMPDVLEAASAAAPVQESAAQAASAPAADPFEGPELTEELLERLEALDLGEDADWELAERLLAALADKQVPEALVARARPVLEMMKKRIVAGKVTRVHVRKSAKARAENRLRRREYKSKRAAMKIQRRKRMRKATSKIKAAKTARKHASLGGLGAVARGTSRVGAAKAKAKAKVGGGLVKHESATARRLAALMAEGAAAPSIRSDIVVLLGECLDLLDWMLADDEVGTVFAEAYEPVVDALCGDALTEGKLDDAAFEARIAPMVQMVGVCMQELEGNG